MQQTKIVEDFLDYRAYVSHTLCQNRLFLGLSNPANARERLRDAYVWPLVYDETKHLCEMTGTLYGIVTTNHLELDCVIKNIGETLKDLDIRQDELVRKNDDSAFEPFCELARQLHNQLREMYTAFKKHKPEYSKDAILNALENKSQNQCLDFAVEYIKLQLAPIVSTLLLDDDHTLKSDLYRSFWPLSSFSFLLTRKAIVAAAVYDSPIEEIAPIRKMQKFLRGVESVVSCWAPSVADEIRTEQVNKTIRAEGFQSSFDLIANLEGKVNLS